MEATTPTRANLFMSELAPLMGHTRFRTPEDLAISKKSRYWLGVLPKEYDFMRDYPEEWKERALAVVDAGDIEELLAEMKEKRVLKKKDERFVKITMQRAMGKNSELQEDFESREMPLEVFITNHNGVDWYLTGKIDGFDPVTGRLVELKTRTDRWKGFCIWDNYQMQMYMYGLGETAQKAIFMEKFRKEKRTMKVERDDYLINRLLRTMKSFIEEFF